ncbi:hypothetical protein HD806DRAFT_511138 [Xylariaceae sp. AK1471]|nr:hypothetical protein HD806DRAFT_511138 [Xylariaceae sp. AK1471]
MATKTKEHPFVKCSENIALLHFLHQVLAPPSFNPEPKDESIDTGYSLPFKEERRLAGIFAFLAHVKDDADHIPAVCLHETPEGHLNILLAVNGRGHPDKENPSLSTIEAGFEKIATVLQGVDGPSQATEQGVFRIIVDICQSRILTRLRFTKKPRDPADKQRMTITNGLQLVIDYFEKATAYKPKNMKLFLERAEEVLKLAVSWSQAESWSQHQILQWLEQLVESINSLRQIDKCEEIILKFIPNKDMGESQRLHLLNMMFKVARYRESAKYLLRTAIKFLLVRQMRVVAVQLPYDAFERLPPGEAPRSTIESTISRLKGLGSTQNNVSRMCDVLKISTEEANTRYADQVKKTLTKSKIHAEIQLFYHCQTVLRGKKLLPRVIRSSKNACWLCNAFLLLHGNIHTPRSHGRLYPGWRLPALHGDWCGDIEARFNQCLEKQLIDSVGNLYREKKRCSEPTPNESDLSIITWMSVESNNTKPTENVAEDEIMQQTTPSLIPDAPMLLEQKTIPSRDETLLVAEVPVKEASVEEAENPNSRTSTESLSAVAASDSSHTSTSSGSMFQEVQDETASNRIPQGKVSQLYNLGPMKLRFEYASNPQQGVRCDSPSRQLSCAMEWLSQEDVQILRREGKCWINAESLTEEETSHSMDMSNSIYLSVQDAVLKVTMRPVS